MLKSKRWFWTSVVLLVLGLVGGVYFGLQVFQNRINGIFASLATDSPSASFPKFDCPWALNPGETEVVTVALPSPGWNYSLQATGTRLDVKPVTPPSRDSQELKWEITAQAGGSGLLVVQAFSSQDQALPGTFHFWYSSFRQGCSVLVSVLGLPYRTYLLLCLVLTLAGAVVFTRRAAGLKKKPYGAYTLLD